MDASQAMKRAKPRMIGTTMYSTLRMLYSIPVYISYVVAIAIFLFFLSLEIIHLRTHELEHPRAHLSATPAASSVV
jgi:uncharacterized membrane protein YqhA